MTAPFAAAGDPPPTAALVAWLAMIPTTAPNLTADERAQITAIRRRATDARTRTRTRCDVLLNG